MVSWLFQNAPLLFTLSDAESLVFKKNVWILTIFFLFLEKELIRRVKEVSIDSLNLTIEFNEFLNMMSNFENDSLSLEGLVVAFK